MDDDVCKTDIRFRQLISGYKTQNGYNNSAKKSKPIIFNKGTNQFNDAWYSSADRSLDTSDLSDNLTLIIQPAP